MFQCYFKKNFCSKCQDLCVWLKKIGSLKHFNIFFCPQKSNKNLFFHISEFYFILVWIHIFLFISKLLGVCFIPAVISRSHEGPGEMGKAVNIAKDDQEKMKELFKINQFNLMASDMIALNRSLPDVRLDGCVSLQDLSLYLLSETSTVYKHVEILIHPCTVLLCTQPSETLFPTIKARQAADLNNQG